MQNRSKKRLNSIWSQTARHSNKRQAYFMLEHIPMANPPLRDHLVLLFKEILKSVFHPELAPELGEYICPDGWGFWGL